MQRAFFALAKALLAAARRVWSGEKGKQFQMWMIDLRPDETAKVKCFWSFHRFQILMFVIFTSLFHPLIFQGKKIEPQHS